MNTIGDRLREFGETKFGKRGMSKLAAALNIPPQSLNNYLKNSQKPGNIMQEKLRNIGADVEYIMTGKRSKVIESDYNALRPHTKKFKVVKSVDAGNPTFIYREENVEYEIDLEYHGNPERCYLVKVVGESMKSTNGKNIEEGDLVLVDMDVQVLNGDVVVVSLTNGREMVKRYIDAGDDNVILRSNNPDYPDIPVKASDIVVMHRVCLLQPRVRFF